MRALTIARVELVRLLRDRSNIFFVLVLPLLLVVLIGAGFGAGFDTRIGIVAPADDDRAEQLRSAVDANDGIRTVPFDDPDELQDAVSRGEVSAGLTVPDDYTALLESGTPVTVGFIGRPDATATSLRTLVQAAVTDQAAIVTAAVVASDATGGRVTDLVEVAESVRPEIGTVEVTRDEAGGDPLTQEFADLGQFDLGASSQLLLFVFLTSMTSAVALIQTRQLGVSTRIRSTPTSVLSMLLGAAGGRFLIAVAQAAYIVIATVLLFQVDWGDPVATGAVVLLFCVVSSGAGMLAGAVFRNESQATGAGIGLGLGMAALGGSMVPLEIFPDTVRTVALVTPHAWANEAMAEIVRRDGGIGDVALQLGVLAAYAVVLLGLATWRLRAVLAR